MTSPVGIIVTFSKEMIYKDIGYDKFIRQFVTSLNASDNSIWHHCLCNKPKNEVLYCYVLFDGKIRYRANIAMFEASHRKTFADGRSFHPRAWMLLCGPVVKAPYDIPMSGFQGFRYCAEMF